MTPCTVRLTGVLLLLLGEEAAQRGQLRVRQLAPSHRVHERVAVIHLLEGKEEIEERGGEKP